MSADLNLVPASSQTVGPYFTIGLDYLIERTPALTAGASSCIEIRGRVLDVDGIGVPDALLEFWSAGPAQDLIMPPGDSGIPHRFRRTGTDSDGSFAVPVLRPAAVPCDDGRMQAPHLLVLIFMRGLLRHLISRVYFDEEPANGSDPVLNEIPADRRQTLMAVSDPETPNVLHWDIKLQGRDETVFFAW